MSTEKSLPQEYHYPAGTVLYREGDEGKEMYVLRSGRVELTKRLRSIEKRLGMMLPGDFFGELSIMCNMPRIATATVLEDANLLVIDSQVLEDMVVESPEITVRMFKKMAAKLAEAGVQIELLMHMDAESRLVHAVHRLTKGARVSEEGYRTCNINPRELALLTGLEEKVVKVNLERLVRADLIRKKKSGLAVAPNNRLDEYIEFLELKSRVQRR
ncbi:MAG: Crp/Fnr family transcriptional regulator [Deltaproteobacteria bacterium]|nr:Crp/Fnr family transcriptional regulator [Deltaproteobacteria bacterium]